MKQAPHQHGDVDWKKLDAHPKVEALCGCGTRYMTHVVKSGSVRPSVFMRDPCPKCGNTRSYQTQP